MGALLRSSSAFGWVSLLPETLNFSDLGPKAYLFAAG